jgi:5'-phosphate synthase pdxT subunit
MKIGILGMQGDIEEHLAIMEKIGVDSIRVKSVKTLETVDGLIMPGGESTTMLKLLKLTGLFDVLKEKIESYIWKVLERLERLINERKEVEK